MMVTEVVKSPNDKKEYRYFKLPNGLAVLIIADPEMADAIHEEEDAEEEEARWLAFRRLLADCECPVHDSREIIWSRRTRQAMRI